MILCDNCKAALSTELHFDPIGRVVTLAGKHTIVTEQQAKIFSLLVAGRPVSRSELADALWPNMDHEPESAVNVISVQISRLRYRLRPLGLRISHNHGTGYTLVVAHRPI